MNRRKLKIEVNGKVNLSLNITGREQGLHRLDTVMTSVSVADAVTVCERFDGRVNVEFIAPFAVPETNTVTKTIDLLRARFGPLGADVIVEKGLPLSGGLGGSSADCAGVIAAFDSLFDLTAKGLSAATVALQAGSDVPYMLSGGLCRVRGVGQEVEPMQPADEWNLVLAAGAAGVSTALCYARFDVLYANGIFCPADTDALISCLCCGDRVGALIQLKNALTEPACTLVPEVRQTLEQLALTGADAVFMTGSGSVCVGAYADADAACRAAQLLRKNVRWVRAVTTQKRGLRYL